MKIPLISYTVESAAPSFVIKSQVGEIQFNADGLEFKGDVKESARVFAREVEALLNSSQQRLITEANALAGESGYEGTVSSINDVADLLNFIRKLKTQEAKGGTIIK